MNNTFFKDHMQSIEYRNESAGTIQEKSKSIVKMDTPIERIENYLDSIYYLHSRCTVSPNCYHEISYKPLVERLCNMIGAGIAFRVNGDKLIDNFTVLGLNVTGDNAEIIYGSLILNGCHEPNKEMIFIECKIKKILHTYSIRLNSPTKTTDGDRK